MGLVFLWLVCGIAAAAVGMAKNRSLFIWFFLGILLGPIGLLMVGFMPAISDPSPRTRRCPHCAEYIMPSAKVCKHCGRDLPAPVRPDGQSSKAPAQTSHFSNRQIVLLVLVVGVFGAVAYGGYAAYQEFLAPRPEARKASAQAAPAPEVSPWKSVSSLEIGGKTIQSRTPFDEVLTVVPEASMTTSNKHPDPDIEGSDIFEKTFQLEPGKEARLVIGRWVGVTGLYRVQHIYVTR